VRRPPKPQKWQDELLASFSFALLGDLYGCRKMYGVELIVVIISTLGVLKSSSCVANGDELNGDTMNIESRLHLVQIHSTSSARQR
jgi:hypothetical protein